MAGQASLSRSGHVAEIRFSKPPHNFVDPDLLRQIADAVESCDADPEVRAIVLLSEGKSFCAGADLAGDENITGASGMDAIGGLYEQAIRLFSRKKPIVAAIQGAAVGAGLGLAVAADFRVASPAARFSANFVRLGFHPGFGLTHTLPRLIGVQRAQWMMLSSERVKAEDAFGWGLVDRMAAPETLLEEAHRMAAEIAENAPLALNATRATLVGSLVDDVIKTLRHEHAMQSMLKTTADYEEGVASVFERRPANFIGR